MTSFHFSGAGSKSIGQRFVTIASACISLCLSVFATPAFAQDISFKDFPYLVYCEFQGVHHAYYFSKLGADGVAIYLTPDRLAGMITIEGVGRRVGGDQSGTCSNKTLDDLRSSGQAYDLQK